MSFSFGAPDAVVSDLDVRARLAATVPIFRLRRPPQTGSLGAGARLVASRVAELAEGGASR